MIKPFLRSVGPFGPLTSLNIQQMNRQINHYLRENMQVIAQSSLISQTAALPPLAMM
jgi:hypothetical protein